MKKDTWMIEAQAECEDCDWYSKNRRNAQATGAKHAKTHKHTVRVEVTLISIYNGKE